MYHNFLIHSSVDGHLGCFHVLLLLLSRFSRVRLCATPQTAARQAPPSQGFSRQEHWSRLPFPSPLHESEVAQACLTLSNPMDCSLSGSSAHGIFRQEDWSGSPLPSLCPSCCKWCCSECCCTCVSFSSGFLVVYAQ